MKHLKITLIIILAFFSLILYLDNQLIEHKEFDFENSIGYVLYPYYGGEEATKNDISINLQICQ